MQDSNGIKSFEINDNSITFQKNGSGLLIFDIVDENVGRVRVTKNRNPKQSIMIRLGFVSESLHASSFHVAEKDDCFNIITSKTIVRISKENGFMTWMDSSERIFLKNSSTLTENEKGESRLDFIMGENEHFYGFGFQRKTFDARGHKLTFTKEYRWAEATVPFFMSTAGYGFFSANTFDHVFDFTSDNEYTVKTTGGEIDFFIFYGPDFKNIIDKYTELTGRPQMVPKWSLGLCYIARVFEDEKGLRSIADAFRKEGIPCDMLGLEPGWEENYYSMEWEWDRKLFPDPEKMISDLKKEGYAFELWESGDAPTKGYLNPENRKKWFEKRVRTSLGYGVDFFKQDDPYPRCITSQEMVTDPTVEIFLQDDDGISEAETRNIANTLYSSTVFEEFRRLTGKRTIVIFHSYNASVSSQRYPTGWAGDFQLGNGALNASLSGHAMVSQDMRNESPKGIHFGFLTPYSLIDSWATYREPWLFSRANVEMTRVYTRLRSGLFPYLYSTLWQSHKKGTPMMRPMILEYQDDVNTYSLDKQFMLGDFLLVGTGEDRNAEVYLPEGRWIDYWTRETRISKGQWENCRWPDSVGGPLFVKAGALIPMTSASDSILLASHDMFILDVYPYGKSEYVVYEDDGITFAYENDGYTLTKVSCEDSGSLVVLKTGKPEGAYEGMPLKKAYLIRMYLDHNPLRVLCKGNELVKADDLQSMLSSMNSGYFHEKMTKTLFIKAGNDWKLKNRIEDMNSFYRGEAEFSKDADDSAEIDITVVKGTGKTEYGKDPSKVILKSRYDMLLADGISVTEIRAAVTDECGLTVNENESSVKFMVTGNASFENGSQKIEIPIVCGEARTLLKSSTTQEEVTVKAFFNQHESDEIIISVVQGEFNVVVNPPERVRLNYGDNWLSYYIFVTAQIDCLGKRIDSAFVDVNLEITGNEDRSIIRKHQAVSSSGVAGFTQIILGSPTQPPDVMLHLDAKGVKPLTIGYKVKENNRKKGN